MFLILKLKKYIWIIAGNLMDIVFRDWIVKILLFHNGRIIKTNFRLLNTANKLKIGFPILFYRLWTIREFQRTKTGTEQKQ